MDHDPDLAAGLHRVDLLDPGPAGGDLLDPLQPLDPDTQEVVSDEFSAQARRVFDNLAAVTEAAGGSLADIVKLTVYLTDLGRFAEVNEIMTGYFAEPYPARAAIGVVQLPRSAQIEIDAIMVPGN